VKLIQALIPAWLVVAAYAAFCLWARTRLPDVPIASHFNGHMQADSWMPRDKVLFTPLTVYAVVIAGLTILPLLTPSRAALERSAKAYGAVCLAVSALFAVILGSVIARPLGWPVGMPETIAAAVGLVFLVIGNFSTKARPNSFYGVRTPWTLSNEAVWDRTHRFAGPALMLGGLFVIVAGIARPLQIVPIVLVGGLVPGALAVAYSYWLWRRLPPEDRRGMRVGA
jgi:uncharacterized membrane protein